MNVEKISFFSSCCLRGGGRKSWCGTVVCRFTNSRYGPWSSTEWRPFNNMPYQRCEIIRFKHTSISYTLAYIWQHTSTVCEHVRNDAHILYSSSCMSSHISISKCSECAVVVANEYCRKCISAARSWTVSYVLLIAFGRPRKFMHCFFVESIGVVAKDKSEMEFERRIRRNLRLRAHSGNTLDCGSSSSCLLFLLMLNVIRI